MSFEVEHHSLHLENDCFKNDRVEELPSSWHERANGWANQGWFIPSLQLCEIAKIEKYYIWYYQSSFLFSSMNFALYLPAIFCFLLRRFCNYVYIQTLRYASCRIEMQDVFIALGAISSNLLDAFIALGAISSLTSRILKSQN